jgi:hypothetical protein
LLPWGIEGYSVHQPVLLTKIKNTTVQSREIIPQRHRAWFPVETALILGPRLVGE